MAKGMRNLNPPCKEYIDLETLATEDDLDWRIPHTRHRHIPTSLARAKKLNSLVCNTFYTDRTTDAIQKNGVELSSHGFNLSSVPPLSRSVALLPASLLWLIALAVIFVSMVSKIISMQRFQFLKKIILNFRFKIPKDSDAKNI